MKLIKYSEKITIENIENLYKTGYISEIIFDADSKTMNIKEAEYFEVEKAIKKLSDSIKLVIDTVCKFRKKMLEALNSIFLKLCNSNKKITKKKFMKLLQSAGIQRNTINEIVKNNKEPYTYVRYYKTLINFQKIK